jgi:lipopolysaccharide export system protein LptA
VEGDRHATAAHASLDSERNVIVLETGARMWDATGSTSADRIRTDQRTGDFVADGNPRAPVNSSRMPDKDPKKNSQMLNGDQPLQAQAQHMESTNHNRTVHYQGKAVMWQGANRVQADTIDVEIPHAGDPGANLAKRGLIADGDVVCNLWQEPKEDEKKKGATPIRTLVHAPHMVYTDENRLAVYTGGVTLDRPSLREKSKELRAYLAESGADSRLEKAYADGGVEIVQTSPLRVRTGTAEHSEYFVDDQKVILRGGAPKLVDNVGGYLQGTELTYFANDDRLLGIGGANQPVQGQIIRHHK